MSSALDEDVADGDAVTNTLWSSADRGDTNKVGKILYPNAGGRNVHHDDSAEESDLDDDDDGHSVSDSVDVNARNCLGCTPLLYACGSGHVSTVRLLLRHPAIDVNRRNNDRLTSFMLAMQPVQGSAGGGSGGGGGAAWGGWQQESGGEHSGHGANAQEKMRRLMDLPATDDLEYTRHDKWTALMEACNFGHSAVVALLLEQPAIDLDAVNLRGQKAEDVAESRGHDDIADMIRKARSDRENPEELPRIQELQKDLDNLKLETRQRLNAEIEVRTRLHSRTDLL